MNKINGWEWIDLESAESTNDEAKKFDRRVVVTAVKQTKGRGRRGRTWIGQIGNLFMSFNLEFDSRVLSQTIIKIGLAVFETVKFFAPGLDVKIKWPNDVLIDGRKVCGILVESRGQNTDWVVGIGVNVKSAPELEGLIYPATSLKDNGIDVDRVEFLKKFVDIFDDVLARDFADVKKMWLLNAKDLGKIIKVKDENFEIEGKFIGIDDNGILMIEREDGVSRIMAGDVS